MMKRKSRCIGLVVWILLGGVAQSQEFLKTTIRDFPVIHSDMQRPLNFDVFVPETGIVLPELGIDQKPVFNEAGKPFRTVTTKKNFDQWYRHTERVNQNIAAALPNQSDSGGYAIADEAFFPIDNLLFGNQLEFHNFHFTMEARGSFVYEEGATASFTGDDDFWLFVDDRLAIDLGGVHDRLSADADLSSLGLQPGETYPIHFFFAERHSYESRFVFETSFEIEQLPADIDGDGRLDTFDLNELCRYGIAEEIPFVNFDINGDNAVTDVDVEAFLASAGSLRGDVNLNGKVDFADFLALSSNFGSTDALWNQGDLNCDARVEFDDFLILSGRFGQTASAALAQVPEPSSMRLVMMCFTMVGVRRRSCVVLSRF